MSLARLARSAVPRLGLVLGGALVGLLLAEGYARTRAYDSAAPALFGASEFVPHTLWAWDDRLGSVPAPGFDQRLRSLDFSVRVRINTLGLRGAEPGPGPHWLAVGDSFVMALQVDEQDTFAARLGRARGVSVLNGGVDSFSGWHAALRYEQLAEQLPIERVVALVFLGNDSVDNRAFLDERGGDPDGRLRQGRPTYVDDGAAVDRLPWWERLLLQHSALYGNIRIAERRARMELGDDPDRGRALDENALFLQGSDQRQAAEIAVAPMLRLQRATHARGAALVVAVAPPYFAMDESLAHDSMALYGLAGRALDLDGFSDETVRQLQAAGITTCDLTPPLRAAHQDGRRPYLRYDGHWSGEGHRVAAQAIDACLDGR